MAFLKLNGTTIRAKSNAVSEKNVEHGVDRARMFTGEVRVTKRGDFREWDITSQLTTADANILIAILKSTTLPLMMEGDLCGDACAVMPILISNNPIQTAQGFRRQVVYQLQETPEAFVDRSALPFMFFARGLGMWNDWARTIPALDTAPLARWDDFMSSGDRSLIGGLNFNFLGYNEEVAPVRQGNRARFDGAARMTFAREGGFNEDHSSYPGGGAGDGLQELEGSGCEIMIGVQVDESPPALASHGGLWEARYGGAVSGNSPDGSAHVFFPHPDGHLWEHFALTNSVDLGAVSGLDSLNAYSVVAFDNGIATPEYTVRLNDTVLYTRTPPTDVGSMLLVINPIIGNGGLSPTPALYGTIRDMVIQPGQFTASQRKSWRDYILGATDDPPLPV